MNSRTSKFMNASASLHSAHPSAIKPLAAAIRAIIATIAFADAAVVRAGELPVPSAALATLGRADQVVSGNKMTINQYTNQAILNWQSFNIGKENTVQFKQPSASAVALNRIFQEDPSRIFGKLTANGQVYLLNQNGFVFGRESQVNVNTLVASTLDITDETFQRGVTKVINQDGRPALIGTGEVYRKDAQGNFMLDANGNKQKIAIQFLEGSRINTDKNGRIIAAAPEIRNAGTLQAPDGQILMVAASDKVYLQEASGDPALRGLIVEVQTGGEVTNAGSLITHRGNTTLMGFAVNQQGRISAKTTVSANGSIRLLAREGARVERSSNGWLLQPGSTRREEARDDGLGKQARVTFGEGSQTIATPDLKSREKAVDGQDQLISRIEVMGQKIQVKDQALIQAKSGDISLTATDNPVEPLLDGRRNKSEIAIDPGAVIDVSGVRNVKLPMSRNIVTVELRSNELRDSPLQRNGILYAKKIRVDIRKGTPIADISGELDRIERTVAERSTTGGKVNLISEGAVTLSPNARIDFSGGSVFYRPGYVNTTQLIAPNGKTVDIGDANPDQRYIGLVGKISQTFKDWNQVNSFNRLGPAESGRYERGYLEGKSAGALDIKGAVLALEGEINAIALNGVHQRLPEQQARGGTLNLDTTAFVDSRQAVVFGTQDPKQPLTRASDDAPLAFKGDEFLKAGLSSARIATNGEVSIAKDATIAMVDGGSLDLTGTRLQMGGAIVAHSGKVHLNTKLGQEDELNGDLILEATARIDTSGKWSNDRPAEGDGKSRFEKSPLWLDGGEVSLKGEGDVQLAKGSLIDVSGGAQRTISREIKPGDAGSISLNAAGLNGSDLATEATLLGYAVAGGRGGKLTLASDKIVIGSGTSAAATEITSPPPEEGAEITVNDNAQRMKPLVIDPGLIGQGGFQDYTLQSNKSGLHVEDGARVELKVQNRILSEGEAASRSSGGRLEEFSQIGSLPDISRPGGSLELILSQTAQDIEKSANLVVGEGALLATDPGGSIHLQSDASIVVNGQLNAPAGTIDLRVKPPSTVQAEQGFLADQGIRLGSTGSLLARGTDQRLTDELGVIHGKVLSGGKVSMTADRGFVATALGSVIDVSGTAAELDLPTRGGAGTRAYRRELVPSSGGSLLITSAEGFLLQGQVNGQPGSGDGAAGADLTLELNNLNRNLPGQLNTGQVNFPANPLIVSLSQWPNVSVPLLDQSEPLPKAYYGKGFISSNQIESGGFSSVTLRTPNKIEINGDTALKTERSIDFDAPVIMAQEGDDGSLGNLNLTSSHVVVGSSLIRPGQYKPTKGDAWFFADAASLDLRGEGVLQGFGYSKLNSAGDLRLIGVNTSDDQRDFKGEFLTTGSLDIVARQLYPTTLSDFRIGILDNPEAILTIHGTGAKPTKVLSAAGQVTLEASNIVQAGAITAPLGEINLKAGENLTLAPGSVTSNSAKGSTIPFGRTQGGLEWIYPLGTQTLVFDAPPEKKLALEGSRVRIEPGSVVDTRGGGKLTAFEFLPGPGGSYDRLDPASEGYQGSYAVMPGYRGQTAPIDPLETPVSDLKAGDSVYLAGGGGLKAGRYVLLPAHYALLPGAYLVTPEPDGVTVLPGDKVSRSDGATVVAGYRAVSGTAIRDAQWSAFAVEKGARAKTRSEFGIDVANTFYQEKADREDSLATPFLPRDGGAIQISAKSELTLDGKVKADGLAKARGGRLDIAADKLNVVDQLGSAEATEGVVNLSANSLNRLGVSSIALGGFRSDLEGETDLTVQSSTVQLDAEAKLRGKDYLLAAKDGITFKQGSLLQASGKAQAGGSTILNVAGDAALVRASTGKQMELFRTGVTSQTGSVRLDGGAKVSATGALMLDATASNQLDGEIEIKEGSLALGAGRVSLGDGDGSASGLKLTGEQLRKLEPSELTLSSASDISFYGDVSISTKKLTLRGNALLGFADAGQTATLEGENIRIDNRNGATTQQQGDGLGTLSVKGKEVVLGEGQYRLGGFEQASLGASSGLITEGLSTLVSAADLRIDTPHVAAGSGANTTIDATGKSVELVGSGASETPAREWLGGRFNVTADSIRNATRIDMPSGVVTLTALNGDVDLAPQSLIDVSGRTLTLGTASVSSPGGTVELATRTGNVHLADGAGLKLQGDVGGTLKIDVPQGAFDWSGAIEAQGLREGGKFAMDIGSTASAGNLGGLSNRIKAAGFSDSVNLSARTGDWTLAAGESLEARMVGLSAESGNVLIAGSLRAQGEGANVQVNAGQSLQLAGTARIEANGTAHQSGRVVLDAVTHNPDNVQGIRVAPGASINVASVDGGPGGRVEFVAARVGKDVAVKGDIGTAVTGSFKTTVEAVKTYQANGTLTNEQVDAYKTETETWMANADSIEKRLNLSQGLRPGISVRSSGDLATSASGWNLVDWRYGGRAGVLSLSAAGNLTINGKLTDGVKDETVELGDGGGSVNYVDRLQTGESWSYRLNAGQDFRVAADSTVRTGTGFIDVKAGNDILLTNSGSSIYTAGRADTHQRYGSFNDLYAAYVFQAEYPLEGGNINLQAGRDIVGALTPQFLDGWYSRQGNWTSAGDHENEKPTAMGISVGGPVLRRGEVKPTFNQNIGALGGGTVNVSAGRNVADLSVVIPNTLKQVGIKARPELPTDANYLTNEYVEGGAGKLAVTAGNDILGGLYFTGLGDTRLNARGSIAPSTVTKLGAIVGLANGRAELQAGQNIELAAAINPSVIDGSTSKSNRAPSLFFTYSENSQLNLQALAGNIRLDNDITGVLESINDLRAPEEVLLMSNGADRALSVYPAGLKLQALGGDIELTRSFLTYPAPRAEFQMMASGQIGTGKLGNDVNVTMSDADPALLPSAQLPAKDWSDASLRLNAYGISDYLHAKIPVHQGDPGRALLFAGGDFKADDPLLFTLPKPVDVYAGLDLSDVSFNIQHSDYAVSSIHAGRDIVYKSPRNEFGGLLNINSQISLSGPGQLWLSAGRDVDLGTSLGVLTLGNTANPALSKEGASVTILAGLAAEGAKFGEFAKKYDPASEKFSPLMTEYVREVTGNENLEGSEASQVYKSMPENLQNQLLLKILFSEIRQSATKAAKSGRTADYKQGYDAIHALFPEKSKKSEGYAGDIKLFFSRISTLAGGDINLMAPGGGVNAGLASAFAGSKSASELGVVVQGDGDVNSIVNKNFMVNQSRVFALNGGDITVWSSNGNIDAGRGAKSALAVPPPVVTFDQQGNLKVEFPPSVSGSGIRTAATTVTRPGDVYLAAPRGVVDAGEAGIGGSNITIAATAVLGASNIQVSGTATGVPATNVSVPVTPAGAAAAATAATNTAQDAVNNDVNQAQEKNKLAENQLNPVMVDILGFGECGVADVRDGKPGCV